MLVSCSTTSTLVPNLSGTTRVSYVAHERVVGSGGEVGREHAVVPPLVQ
jgi:hypothetical protein